MFVTLTLVDFNHLYFLSRHGRFCAKHPKKVIFASLSLSLLSCLGFLNFQWEASAIKLWIPSESDFAKNYAYLWENHPPDMRFHSLLFTTDNEVDNILEPKYMQRMYQTLKKVQNIRSPSNKTWEDLCFRLPVVKVNMSQMVTKRRRRNVAEDEFFNDSFDEMDNEDFIKEYDPSVDLYPQPYCNIVESELDFTIQVI